MHEAARGPIWPQVARVFVVLRTTATLLAVRAEMSTSTVLPYLVQILYCQIWQYGQFLICYGFSTLANSPRSLNNTYAYYVPHKKILLNLKPPAALPAVFVTLLASHALSYVYSKLCDASSVATA